MTLDVGVAWSLELDLTNCLDACTNLWALFLYYISIPSMAAGPFNRRNKIYPMIEVISDKNSYLEF